jgi:hypothetical protein
MKDLSQAKRSPLLQKIAPKSKDPSAKEKDSGKKVENFFQRNFYLIF